MAERPHQKFKSRPPAESWLRRGRLWQCPACGKQYPRHGQGHSCSVVSLEHHFADRPRARELFNAFRAAIEDVGGPVRLSVAKTRIGFITGITFAAVMPRKVYLRAGFLLLRRLDSPRIVKTEHLPPWWSHTVEIHDEADIDHEVRDWLQEAYGIAER